jgi:hypothetical protein
MKFDVVIGNPPYKRDLHLRLFNKALDIVSQSGHVLIIHPAMWTRLLRNTTNKRKFDEFKNRIRNKTKSVTLVEGRKWFDITIRVPLAIVHVVNNKDNNKLLYDDQWIDDIDDANHLGKYSIIKSIENKVLSVPTVIDKLTTQATGGWYVSLTSICGHGSSTYTYDDGITRKHQNKYHLINRKTILPLTEPHRSSPMRNTNGNLKQSIRFETYEEAQSFIKYLNTSSLVRYLCITYIEGQHSTVMFEYLPLSTENIILTEEEQNFITQTIEKYKI